MFEAGDLRVDLERREVRRDGQEVHLTPTEYKLLTLLIRHAGKVLTHRQLLKEVWGVNYAGQSHYVGCTWPSSGRSWRVIPLGRGCCSRSPAWVTG